MKFALVLFCAPALLAQSVQLFSELQRIGPFGKVLSQDRSPSPREIISPAAARNGFASFHIAVSVPEGQNFFLYIQANPSNILRMKLYKEEFASYQGVWIPDALIETASPSFGVIPEAEPHIAAQTSRSYLLDIWVPPDAEIGRRVRVEVLLKFGTWYVAPMELRIQEALVRPPLNASPAPLPGLEEPADSAALHALATHFAGQAEWNQDAPLTVRHVLRRNAQQDMTLASPGSDPALWLRAASAIANRWTPLPYGAEWYLRVRDLLISRLHP